MGINEALYIGKGILLYKMIICIIFIKLFDRLSCKVVRLTVLIEKLGLNINKWFHVARIYIGSFLNSHRYAYIARS